ncbi:MAG: hypothetical protein IJ650_00445 [Paludibacteraceae bacterium]|nr:hypothetical protein [Paludibacteraceae bacterium]
MENIIIENLKHDIDALREELDLAEKRANQIKQTLDALEQRLAECEKQAVDTDESNLPEVEMEFYVDDIFGEEDEELLTDEELEVEDSVEDALVEEIEKEAPKQVEVQPEEEKVEEKTEAPAEVVTEPAPEPALSKPASGQSVGQNNIGVNLPHVDDMRKAMSLGDRFLFQRELFQGDGEKMNKTIDQLNSLKNMDEAMLYIGKRFQWDTESQAYELFLNILKRRF